MRMRSLMAFVVPLGMLPLIGAFFLVGCKSSDSSAAVKRLNGGGATFVDPIMQEWAFAYHAATGVQINYQAGGSGAGIQQMTNRTIDFGCSDAAMKKAQLDDARKNGGEVIHIPLIMGPVVPGYNVPGVDRPIVFDGKVLADIYLGKVKKWDDPALKSLNPGVNLPDLEISPVYRSDASGTTSIFTEFLAKSSPEFKTQVGVSTQPSWPRGVGTGEPKSAGVANRVKTSPGTIGYFELNYARSNKLAYGPVRNRAGKAVLGTPEGVTLAAAEAMKVKQDAEPYSLHELTFSLTDPAGDDSYPIGGITYGVIYQKQKSEMGKALKEFLRWVTHDGQAMAAKLDYAPLPPELVKKIEARLDQIELEP